jgi:hypothetical protein
MKIYRQIGASTEDPFPRRVWGYQWETWDGRRPDSLDNSCRYPGLLLGERGAPSSYQVLLGMEVHAQPIDLSLEPGGETEGSRARPPNHFRAVLTKQGASFLTACQVLVETDREFLAAEVQGIGEVNERQIAERPDKQFAILGAAAGLIIGISPEPFGAGRNGCVE